MTRTMKLFLSVLFVACLFGCNKPKSATGTAALGQSEMVFETLIQSLGDVRQDEVLGIKFSFKNNGSSPLVISEINKGCGCTTVNYPKHAVKPGGQGVIEVIFDSAGFSGKQYKTVQIFCNDAKSPIQLAFTANVLTNY